MIRYLKKNHFNQKKRKNQWFSKALKNKKSLEVKISQWLTRNKSQFKRKNKVKKSKKNLLYNKKWWHNIKANNHSNLSNLNDKEKY